MTITENTRKLLEGYKQNEELKAKIDAQEGKDDALEQIIAAAKEYGFTMTMEDFNALTEEDFKAETNSELDLDDLEKVAGGFNFEDRTVFCPDCGAVYIAKNGHDCPER